jgi:probable HAF family extracellular repeat protein
MQDIGTLPAPYNAFSEGLGINDSAEVVGIAYSSSSVMHAFVYSNGTMQDLNSLIAPDSGWTVNSAGAINDLGQIVGFGTNAAGQEHAILLTPVPEPSALSLLAVGALSFVRCLWRSRSRATPIWPRGRGSVRTSRG